MIKSLLRILSGECGICDQGKKNLCVTNIHNVIKGHYDIDISISIDENKDLPE